MWHEKAGGIDEVTLDREKTKWSQGRATVTINADGATDLGDIKVNEALFESSKPAGHFRRK